MIYKNCMYLFLDFLIVLSFTVIGNYCKKFAKWLEFTQRQHASCDNKLLVQY